MAEKKPDILEINLRMPAPLKKELTDYAQKEMTSANAVIRKFIRDGLVKAEKRKTET